MSQATVGHPEADLWGCQSSHVAGREQIGKQHGLRIYGVTCNS